MITPYYIYKCDNCGKEVSERSAILVEDYSDVLSLILKDADTWLSDDQCFCSIKCLLLKINSILNESVDKE